MKPKSQLAGIVKVNIETLCKNEKFAKKKISEICNINPSTVSKWICDDPSLPSTEYLYTIANYYHVTVDWILTDHAGEQSEEQMITRLAKYNQAFLALTALTDRNMLDADNIKEPILRYLVKRYQEIKGNKNEDLKPWIDKIVDWFDMALPSSSDEVFTNVMKNKFQNISKDLADAVYLSIAKSISPDYMDDDAGIEDDGTDDYLYDKCDD